MSTFSGLNAAYTGLTAAQLGLDVVGQNMANVTTDGYTRQRVSTSALGPVANTGQISGGNRPGQGVFVSGISRLGSATRENQVRTTAADQGFWDVRAHSYEAIEEILREPGDDGISATLSDFWAAWQDLGNHPGDAAAASSVLQHGKTLAIDISRGQSQLDERWDDLRGNAEALGDEINGLADQVAQINNAIRKSLASGGTPNELVDQRNQLTEKLAAKAGAVVRDRGDGMIDVTLGGNALVSGTHSRTIEAAGASHRYDLGDQPAVHVTWSDNGETVGVSGGQLGGILATLAPADEGGTLAAAADAYDQLAEELAAQLNAAHEAGQTSQGDDGGPFFSFDASRPAQSLAVVPTGADQLASALDSAGALNGGNADRIAELQNAADSPDALWSSFVTRTGVSARAETQQSDLADLAASSASERLLSESSVDIDEEQVNLLMYQHAYQGAARVMTAMDEMLDTLINRTGIVGR